MFSEAVTAGVTLKFKFTKESHPAELLNVIEYNPAAAYELPFHEYGSCPSQMEMFSEAVKLGEILKFKVTTESHPAALLRVNVGVLVEVE